MSVMSSLGTPTTAIASDAARSGAGRSAVSAAGAPPMIRRRSCRFIAGPSRTHILGEPLGGKVAPQIARSRDLEQFGADRGELRAEADVVDEARDLVRAAAGRGVAAHEVAERR